MVEKIKAMSHPKLTNLQPLSLDVEFFHNKDGTVGEGQGPHPDRDD